MIIRKYANSIGRTYDAPDVVLRITSRNVPAQHAHRSESDARILSPDEPIFETLDKYYPRGQSVEDALLIDVPPKPTPKSSPRPGQHLAFYNPAGDLRPVEGLTEYFPPMPVTAIPSPHLPGSPSAVTNGIVMQTPHLASMHSITVLSTGQIPQLPSPGVSRHPVRHLGIATGVGRPPYARTHTASPPGGAPGQLPHGTVDLSPPANMMITPPEHPSAFQMQALKHHLPLRSPPHPFSTLRPPIPSPPYQPPRSRQSLLALEHLDHINASHPRPTRTLKVVIKLPLGCWTEPCPRSMC